MDLHDFLENLSDTLRAIDQVGQWQDWLQPLLESLETRDDPSDFRHRINRLRDSVEFCASLLDEAISLALKFESDPDLFLTDRNPSCLYGVSEDSIGSLKIR